MTALARNTDPVTSHQAADYVNVTKREAEVLAVLEAAEFGLTTNEIAKYLGRSLVSISPRLKPLVIKMLVEDSGNRRSGPEGRARIIWRVKR